MVIYHTIRLSATDDDRTFVYDLTKKEETINPNELMDVIDTYNLAGYNLTAVHRDEFFMTKRVD